MDGVNNMAQSQAAAQRPPFPHQQSSLHRDYAVANARANLFSPQSPQTNLAYSSPSPQSFSPQTSYAQPPAAKRPRLSPEAPHSNSPNYSPVMRPGSTPNGLLANGSMAGPPRPMAPPPRPVDRNQEDKNYEDLLSASGVNQEEEWRTLTTQRTSGYANGFTGASVSAGLGTSLGGGTSTETQISAEEQKLREEERADWEASRRAQHPLWNSFLWTGTLNEKIRQSSASEHLVDPQSGVLVNTQKNAPPPSVRVDGLEGASRVIDQGQSILNTSTQGERLTEMLKLISLATKTRLTGILGAAARLSYERREYSKGRIPDEWTNFAAKSKPGNESTNTEPLTSPAASSALKRTHSQMIEDGENDRDDGLHPVAAVFNKSADAERKAEEIRLAKRAKRKAAQNADKAQAAADAEAAEAQLAALEADSKKTSKKQQKVMDTKFTEQQQHKSTNEAARLATSNLFGKFGSKKGKTYSWMSGGGASGTATPSSTPNKAPTGASSGTTTTPAGQRATAASKPNQLPAWDEDKDPGVQVRDVLLVLESDAKAPRSYVRGYSALDH